MRKTALLLLLLLALIGIAVLWQAPATLVGGRVDKLTQGRIKLADPIGTVWRGTGVVALGETRLPIAWQLHPTPLVRGEVGLTIGPAPGATGPRADLTLAEGSARARGLALSLPAAALVPLLIDRPRLDAGGTLDVQSADLGWTPAGAQGSVTVDWHDATIGLAGGTPIALGEVSAALRAADGQFTGPIANRGGEFALDGILTVAPNGGGEIRGTVRPRAPGDSRLGALAPLGRANESGVAVEWRWPGR